MVKIHLGPYFLKRFMTKCCLTAHHQISHHATHRRDVRGPLYSSDLSGRLASFLVVSLQQQKLQTFFFVWLAGQQQKITKVASLTQRGTLKFWSQVLTFPICFKLQHLKHALQARPTVWQKQVGVGGRTQQLAVGHYMCQAAQWERYLYLFLYSSKQAE